MERDQRRREQGAPAERHLRCHGLQKGGRGRPRETEGVGHVVYEYPVLHIPSCVRMAPVRHALLALRPGRADVGKYNTFVYLLATSSATFTAIQVWVDGMLHYLALKAVHGRREIEDTNKRGGAAVQALLRSNVHVPCAENEGGYKTLRMFCAWASILPVFAGPILTHGLPMLFAYFWVWFTVWKVCWMEEVGLKNLVAWISCCVSSANAQSQIMFGSITILVALTLRIWCPTLWLHLCAGPHQRHGLHQCDPRLVGVPQCYNLLHVCGAAREEELGQCCRFLGALLIGSGRPIPPRCSLVADGKISISWCERITSATISVHSIHISMREDIFLP